MSDYLPKSTGKAFFPITVFPSCFRKNTSSTIKGQESKIPTFFYGLMPRFQNIR